MFFSLACQIVILWTSVTAIGLLFLWSELTGMSYESNPMIRSRLAQSVYRKMMNDEKLKNMDFSMWYKVRDENLSENSRRLFVEMEMDPETQLFLDKCFEQSDYLLLQIWHSVARSFLGLFMSQTSVNGLLSRGRMFVWSRTQARKLLQSSTTHVSSKALQQEQSLKGSPKSESVAKDCDEGKSDLGSEQCKRDKLTEILMPFSTLLNDEFEATKSEGSLTSGHESEETSNIESECQSSLKDWWENKNVLDLGAGDGHVTQILSQSNANVYATETSPVMRKRLGERNYKLLDAFSWAEEVEDGYFDLITCLNVLDRCDKPTSLLKDIHGKLSRSGRLVIALVLPISPYVEGSASHIPSEHLDIKGEVLEVQVNSLMEDVFPELGYRVIRWTKLPYLCEGDMEQSFYWLPDIMFILEKIHEEN